MMTAKSPSASIYDFRFTIYDFRMAGGRFFDVEEFSDWVARSAESGRCAASSSSVINTSMPASSRM